MRIYRDLKEAFGEIQRDLVEMGTEVHPETYQDKKVKDDPNFCPKEIQGYSYSITNLDAIYQDFLDLGGNGKYAEAEYLDRISLSWENPGNAWVNRKSTWEPFIQDNGRFSYTYNERFREQLPMIIEELQRNPNTRQAVITMYDRHQDMANLGGKARIPCSMYYQYLLRRVPLTKDLRLDSIYTMRSCDIYTHFIYDVYLATMVQKYIAGSIGVEYGKFTQFIGSLHAYKKDYETKEVF
jgi:thymidylate synthase